MTKAKLRTKLQRLFNRLRHETKPEASRTDWDVLLSHEDISSPNVTVRKEGTVLEREERIVDLTRELGKLRECLAHDRAISEEMLMNLLPMVQVHCKGFSEAICQFRNIIERVSRERRGNLPLPKF